MCLGVLLHVGCHVVIVIKLKRVCPLGAWPKGDTLLSSVLKKVSRYCLHTTIPLLRVIKSLSYGSSCITSEVPGHSSKLQKVRTYGIFMGKENDLFGEKRTSGGLRNIERPGAKCTCR
jgi:hypothetical protein